MGTQSGIYCITFLPTQQKYIGSTKKFSTRFSGHKHDLRNNDHHSWKLQQLWNESQNEIDLAFIILEVVEDLGNLIEREQFWLDALKPELNVMNKAHRLKPESQVSPWAGKHRSQEVRDKISKSLTGRKGHPMSSETREKLRIANTGKKMSDATKAKLVASHKGIKPSAELRAKWSAQRKGRKGKPVSEETKAKLRAIAQAQWNDPEYKRKHHKALKKVMSSPEMRKKLSEGGKGKKLSEEHKKKIGDLHRGMKRSAASRRRLSAARKLWWKNRKRNK